MRELKFNHLSLKKHEQNAMRKQLFTDTRLFWFTILQFAAIILLGLFQLALISSWFSISAIRSSGL
ncbi:hypothetical protein MHBO_004164 [Bonamia ostreae]|uniref:Uncharacterized protein n=2 Tax=Bonamia ostreae TaxID=126728 RepID=A0ABV2ASJ7_9EUKA